jgi:hypothetical protein
MHIIALSGGQGSGKSTIAKALGHPVLKFAEPLYYMHGLIKQALRYYGEPQGEEIHGRLLQLLGTEFGRDCLDKDIWVRIWERQARLMPEGSVLIVDDLRFPNEFLKVQSMGAYLVRLECDEATRKARAEKWRPTGHASETALVGFHGQFDLTLNTGELSVHECVERIQHGLSSRRSGHSINDGAW